MRDSKIVKNRKNWCFLPLGDLCDIFMGQSPPSSSYNRNRIGLPFYQGKSEFGEISPIPAKWCSEPIKIVKKNDILLSVRAPVGPTNICLETSSIGRGLSGIRYLFRDEYKYIFYFLRSIEKDLNLLGTGSTFSAISKSQISNLQIPLPPLPEQHRIVAKIEELFTKLDAGVAALQKAKALLKRYRQAVLKAAVEGRLTEEWRKEHADRLEPSSVLLERIQAERKQRLGSKYKAPKPVDTTNLPELPEGWVWAKLGSICDNFNKVQPKDKPNERFIYIDISSINNSINQITTPKSYLGINAPSRARQLVKTDDILFSTVRTYLKNIAIVPKEYDGQIASTGFCVVRPIIVNSRFINIILNNEEFLNSLSKIQRGTSYPAVRNSDVFNQNIPLPSIEEQKEIVNECSRLISLIDESEQIINAELKRSQSLRQSILKRAFAGKLVPQNPADEPASVLLEKIRKEKKI